MSSEACDFAGKQTEDCVIAHSRSAQIEVHTRRNARLRPYNSYSLSRGYCTTHHSGRTNKHSKLLAWLRVLRVTCNLRTGFKPASEGGFHFLVADFFVALNVIVSEHAAPAFIDTFVDESLPPTFKECTA